MTNIALRIRRARVLAKLSQSELAGRVGVNRSAVAQWEREGGTHPSVEHLATVSVATRVPFEWLATGRGDPAECPPSDVPAVAIEYAVDDTEARLLEAIRRLPVKKRHAVCRLIEELASKG
jgi:transcriptional regulator with XRE-family HTH domain